MFTHNPEVNLVTEAILAHQAKQDALAKWDEGEREAAAHFFLRTLAGPRDPRGIHAERIAGLRAVACTNNRQLFEQACDLIAEKSLLHI